MTDQPTQTGRPLAGQHAVITGGSRGIGRAIASALLAHGAKVTIIGRSAERLQAAARSLLRELADEPGAPAAAPAAVQAIAADVTRPEAVSQAFAQAHASGAIHILVNNAGNAESAPFHRTGYDLWERMISANLTSAYLCTQAVVPGMVERGYGRIVNIASTAALTGYAYVTAYCAAKHGVLGLTRALALELARSGVTVNAVCPGYTETDMLADAVANVMHKTGRSEPEARAEFTRHNPQGRLVQPDEVAHSVLWLCLPGSDALTGQAIAVAGGEII